MLDGKTILITGGTGSFGHKCTEYIIKNYLPKKLIIFSRDEMKQWEMQKKFTKKDYPNLRYFVGDVRDQSRLYRAFDGVDYVIHAAALKIVPVAEYNPFEVIRTNIIGSENVIEAAIDKGVHRVIALSTDKAVSPVNLYGATKLCSEKLFIAGNSYVGEGKTRFSVVRYGNVVGSRGSVIPLFMGKKRDGVIPITDPRMTRFFITLEQGVRFVLNCMEKMVGGEVFVPKLPSMNILELAKAIAPECKTEIIGIRPGEKLHEVMISKDESRNTLEMDDLYMIRPEFSYFKKRFKKNGHKDVPDGFEYCSGSNSEWLTTRELEQILPTLSC